MWEKVKKLAKRRQGMNELMNQRKIPKRGRQNVKEQTSIGIEIKEDVVIERGKTTRIY